MEPHGLIAIAAVLMLAALAQAVTGFGFSLLAVPLLALLTGPQNAVVGSSIVALLLSGVTAVHDRGAIHWRTAREVLIAGTVGLPIGLAALALLPARALTIIISLVVLGSTWLIWKEYRIGRGRVATAAVGVLSGALTTSTGVNGPPLAAAFQVMGFSPRQFRATLAAIFAAIGTIGVAGFLVTEQVSRVALLLAIVGVPATAAGWFIGNKAFARISAGTRFRQTVLYSLVVASLVTLANALL